MRVFRCKASNFGSYKDIDIDLDDSGLALIHGNTGSGKSTLQDLIPWVLFGVTAKDGNVDEVRNWSSNGTPTVGTVWTDTWVITRVRGSTKENDLIIAPLLGAAIRGKDLADTQKLINDLIGVNADTYTTATSFNEFSEAGLFFLSKPKDRRQVFEKVANLNFPSKIALKASIARKEAKKQLEVAQTQVLRLGDKLEALKDHMAMTERYLNGWEVDLDTQLKKLQVKEKHFDKEKSSTIEALETKSYRFEADKEKKVNDLVDKLDALGQRFDASKALKEERLAKALAALPRHCDKCGKANNTSDAIEKLKADIEKSNEVDRKFIEYSNKLREVQAPINPYKGQVAAAKKLKNHYEQQIVELTAQVNPFQAQLDKVLAAIPEAEAALDAQIAIHNKLQATVSGLGQIYDLSFELRGVLLKKAVKAIQDRTNGYLERYFDSEFKVTFELENADNLAVAITKNGYPCVYKQLSKGQRQLLKLCFSVSIMLAAANNAGISFNLLTFDEALDGLDGELKVKAFGLFESLAKDHESVLVIDHNQEFQDLFSNRYKVTLVGDESKIERE